jgi:hypothetical protein
MIVLEQLVPSAKDIHRVNVSILTVLVSLELLKEEITLLIALLISIPIIALVASVPSKVCVLLTNWLRILLWTRTLLLASAFNTFGPEFRKLVTADVNIADLALYVSLPTSTVILALTEIMFLPSAKPLFLIAIDRMLRLLTPRLQLKKLVLLNPK